MASNAMFTIGTAEEKMDMSLDAIIKEKKGGRGNGRGNARGANRRESLGRGGAQKSSALERRKMLVERAKGNAKARTSNRVERMRGIQTNNGQTKKSDLSITVKNNNWLKQEAVREKERKKKLQKYKQSTSGNNSSPATTKKVNNANNNTSDFKIRVQNKPFHFDAPPSAANNQRVVVTSRNNRNPQGGRRNNQQQQQQQQQGRNNNQSGQNQRGGRRNRVVDRIKNLGPQRTVSFKKPRGGNVNATGNRRGVARTGTSTISGIFGSVNEDTRGNRNAERNNNTSRGDRGGRGGRGGRGTGGRGAGGRGTGGRGTGSFRARRGGFRGRGNRS